MTRLLISPPPEPIRSIGCSAAAASRTGSGGDGAGEDLSVFTCEPDTLDEPIHPKAMPVILHEEDYDRWLGGEVDEVCALAQPFPSQMMAVT